MRNGGLISISEDQINLLNRLARLYGIDTSYQDVSGRIRQAEPHSLLLTLQALGVPIETPDDLPAALQEYTLGHWHRCVEPVTVSWNTEPVSFNLRLPQKLAQGWLECTLHLETGQVVPWVCNLAELPVRDSVLVEGTVHQVRSITVPSALPPGYHHLTLNLPSGRYQSLIISAPLRAYAPPGDQTDNLWGVFLPLYALHSRRSWGAGDFADLAGLIDWVHELGGDLVGTLPLLPAFLDEPFEPSPYMPVSRLLWNEFFIDVTQVEEIKQCPQAQEMLNSAGILREIERLRSMPLVDYRSGMAVKRKILECCGHSLFIGRSPRRALWRQWIAGNPQVADYARFRATVERRRSGWTEWPAPMREGTLHQDDYDLEAEQYHLYVQWLAHEQFERLSGRARMNRQKLYLDLPLGVHHAGYDVWRHRDCFAMTANAGAPPDTFFTLGQNWGFPPLHPEKIRENGYAYFISCLRHHLRHAGILRLDHVMGLHRLFWIPEGVDASQGVYVRYRAEEFYAILTLESQRHQSLIVGEDLGTVPEYVHNAMAEHGVSRMYVLPFQCTGDPENAVNPVPANALATLNTHDMPPFAAFWHDDQGDPVSRAALCDFLGQQGRFSASTNEAEGVSRACLIHLAACKARILLVNLEDLWMETSPQNVPGTVDEYPNWRRKARYSMEDFSHNPQVLDLLNEINHLRKACGRLTIDSCRSTGKNK